MKSKVNIFYNFLSTAAKYKSNSARGLHGARSYKKTFEYFDIVTTKDLLCDFLRNTKLKTDSFIRYSDRNHLEGKEGKTIRLKWLKKDGHPLDLLALDFSNQYDYLGLDESTIIEDIVDIVVSFPSGCSGYALARYNEQQDEIKEFERYAKGRDLKPESAPDEFDWDHYFDERKINSTSIKKSKSVTKKSKTVLKKSKTVTVATSTKKSVNRSNKNKSVLSPEYTLIKRLYAFNRKPISVAQLSNLSNKVNVLLKKAGIEHKQLLKTIKAKLDLAIFKLQGENITNISSLTLTNDLEKSLAKAVLKPKVTVTLGGIDKSSKFNVGDICFDAIPVAPILKMDIKQLIGVSKKYLYSITGTSIVNSSTSMPVEIRKSSVGKMFSPLMGDKKCRSMLVLDLIITVGILVNTEIDKKNIHQVVHKFVSIVKVDGKVYPFLFLVKVNNGNYIYHPVFIDDEIKKPGGLSGFMSKGTRRSFLMSQRLDIPLSGTNLKINSKINKPFAKEQEFFSLDGIVDCYTDAEIKQLGIVDDYSLGKVNKKSPYDLINEKLIAMLKTGELPWVNQRKNAPYQGQDNSFRNYDSKRAYSGINVMLLNSEVQPHHNSFFLTKNQIAARGKKLNKGAKGIEIFFAKKLTVQKETPATATAPAGLEDKKIWMMKQYTIYNLADTDIVIKDKDLPQSKTEEQVIESCETVYKNMPKKPVLKHGGSGAFYNPNSDYVNMPNKNNFTSLQGYYRTLFHELIHSTGHSSRLKRKFGTFNGSKEYNIEELIAEIGSSYVCGYTGIFFANAEKHASYLDHYLKALHGKKLAQYKADLVFHAQEDKTFLLHAIGAAQKAANFILSKQLAAVKKKPKKLPGINSLNGVTEDTMAPITSKQEKSPFTTMNKLVSGGTYQLAGEIGKLLGNLGQVDCSITIKGDQGAGKSQLMWQLVDAFATAGKKVAVVSPEMNGNSPTVSKYRDQYISNTNQDKILFTDQKLTVQQLCNLSKVFDVVFVDSFNQLKDYKQDQFEWLSKKLPNKCIVGLFQSTTSGEMRGGNKPEFDAYVNIEVVKVDDTFKNNYAVCSKNRFGGTGVKFNISKQKIVK